MAPISTKLHGALDYPSGLSLLAAPFVLSGEDLGGRALLAGAGAGGLLTSAITDYEFGLRRRLPVKAHLLIDAATGLGLAAGAVARRRGGAGWRISLVLLAAGVGELAGAALTERQAGDRRDSDSLPGAPTGVSHAPLAAATAPTDGVPIAPPPVETPGPSVTPPQTPESDVERAEKIDATLPDGAQGATGEALIAQEEAAAAAEARRIGGLVPHEVDDPAMEPVYEAGGGEAEGWEAAEADLIENASHGEGFASPERDAFTPELESDRAGAVYGESDSIPTTELTEDPHGGPDDPAAGPGLSADRGSDIPPRDDPRSRVD